MQKTRKSVRWVAIGLFAGIGLIMVLLLLEVIFRFHPDYGRVGFVYDRDVLFHLTPGLVAEKPEASGQTGQPPFTLRFNEYGLRGEDIREDKPNDVERVILLGDSYTSGLDYPAEKTLGGQLLQRLQRSHPDRTYEVINASCPAWGMDQIYLFWQHYARHWQPDAVLLIASPNDLREMWNKRLVELRNGEVVSHRAELPFGQRLGWWLAAHSSFFQFLQKKVLHSNHGDFLKVFHTYPVNYGVADSTDWDMPLYLSEPIAAIDSSYLLYEKLLVDMQQTCQRSGVDFTLVKLPIRNEIDATYQLPGLDPRAVDTRLRAIAGRNGVPFLDLRSILDRDSTLHGPDLYMDWEYHLDADGHRWVGEQLFEWMQKKQY